MKIDADRESAVTLCRLENEGRCVCARDDRPVCALYAKRVEELGVRLKVMRAAIADIDPEDEATVRALRERDVAG